jgi:hypothetical protein
MMNVTNLAADARVTRLVYDGQVYFPIVRAGAVLGPEEVAELVATPAPAASRRFVAVVADESPVRDRAWRLDLDGFAPPAAVPLTYGDTVFTLGVLEELAVMPSGTVDGATGRALVGVGRLYPNALAAVVWPAITSRLLAGVCPEVLTDGEGDQRVVRGLVRVTLGGLENNCIGSARILDAWEGDNA